MSERRPRVGPPQRLALTLAALITLALPARGRAEPPPRPPLDALISCYNDLNYECATAEAERALAPAAGLSATDTARVRAYQALIAFAYREPHRVRALLLEMLSADLEATLPAEAPRSMHSALSALRAEVLAVPDERAVAERARSGAPEGARWSLSARGERVSLTGRDAALWAAGWGGGLWLSRLVSPRVRLELSGEGARHAPAGGGLSAHLQQLTVAHARLGAAIIGGPIEVAASGGGGWALPEGLFELKSHAGLSLGLEVRGVWTPSRAVGLSVVGAIAGRGLLLPEGGVVAWSQLWALSLGLRYSIGGGA